LAVRDPAIAVQIQEFLKWHKRYAAGDPLIASRELAKQQEQYTIQDPGTASQELARWQKMYATRNPETAKQPRKQERQFIARGEIFLVIKNYQTSTM
jgi:hypothetical protein